MKQTFENVDCAVCATGTSTVPVAGSRTDIYFKKFGLPLSRSKWTFCSECTLLYQNPRPSLEAMHRFYQSGLYFGSRSADIQRLKRVALRKHREKLSEAFCGLSLLPAGLAVDIGCGIGGAVARMKELGLNPVGVEPDPVVAKMGREEFGLDIRAGLFGRGLLEKESVSFFYSNHVFEHLQEPNEVVAAMAEALKPGGRVFVCVPTFWGGTSWEAYAWQNLSHNYLFTHQTLAQLFSKHGLVTLRWKYVGASNELWLLAEKPVELRSYPAPIEKPALESVLRYYRYAVPLRAVVFFPRRFAFLLKEVFVTAREDGLGGLKQDLISIFRTPLADTYRACRSLFLAGSLPAPAKETP